MDRAWITYLNLTRRRGKVLGAPRLHRPSHVQQVPGREKQRALLLPQASKARPGRGLEGHRGCHAGSTRQGNKASPPQPRAHLPFLGHGWWRLVRPGGMLKTRPGWINGGSREGGGTWFIPPLQSPLPHKRESKRLPYRTRPGLPVITLTSQSPRADGKKERAEREFRLVKVARPPSPARAFAHALWKGV